MNGERFLEAINRLPFSNSVDALRSFARTSRFEAYEQALLQMLVVLDVGQARVTSGRPNKIDLSFSSSTLNLFYESVLPKCSFVQKIVIQNFYRRFLSVYMTCVYQLYRQRRVENLLRYVDVSKLEICSPDKMQDLLIETEQFIFIKYKASITEFKSLKECFVDINKQWKHQFYTKNIWISLMWISLAGVLLLSIALSTRGSPFKIFEAVVGWFEFFRESVR